MKKAKWIWKAGGAAADEYAEFHDGFSYAGGGAEIELSCDSNYALYVNGRLAGFSQYADFPHYKVSDTIDIAEFLNAGENVLKIVVWYYGAEFQTYYMGKAGLIYEVARGGKTAAWSSPRTRCGTTADYVGGLKKIITGQLGYSFRYDTRRAEPALSGAVVQDGMPGALRPRPIKRLELTDTFFGEPIFGEPIGASIGGGRKIYDLSRERVGFLHIKFKAESGALVTVSYGEHLADGEVRRRIDGRDFSVELIANGETAEYLNPFRRLGCRYLQVDCAVPVDVQFIGIRETLYPLSVRPFRADTESRQRIYDVCVRTLQLCMHEHYEDCPWREQALYTMDSRNQMLCGYYAFGEYAFARANLKLIGEDRRADGLLSICSPSKVDLTIPSFSLYYVAQMREYAEHSGDDTLLAEYYGKLRRIVGIFADRAEGGLVPAFYGDKAYWNFYEWADGLAGTLWGADEKRFDLILNALFSRTLQSMSAISRRLGRDADGAGYGALSARVNEAINARFFDGGRGLYKTFENGAHFCELGNALAVLCGAAAGGRAEGICAQLAGEGGAGGGSDGLSGGGSGGLSGEVVDMVPATLSMICFKYDALLATDGGKYAAYVLSDIDKNYKYMLDAGATSFWETIKGESDFGNAGSLCHGWSAMPVYYYHKLLP
ncbi:MAG: family 78 glycoside hydrolase catalytic domain [Clostridiales bacterium]|jgi:hypothetical protein|nr:family 78 glycoside hydrolase catalytic domain [Clostridiales bacterium]